MCRPTHATHDALQYDCGGEVFTRTDATPGVEINLVDLRHDGDHYLLAHALGR